MLLNVTDSSNIVLKREPSASTPVSANQPLALYDVNFRKNDANDAFDERELLRHVPLKEQPKAKLLLSFFNRYPEQVTWDSDGIIYIDQVPIPNSNIYKIFHCLFKSVNVGRFVGNASTFSAADPFITNAQFGLDELMQKIESMHLSHLILRKREAIPDSSFENLLPNNLTHENFFSYHQDIPWWYIGP